MELLSLPADGMCFPSLLIPNNYHQIMITRRLTCCRKQMCTSEYHFMLICTMINVRLWYFCAIFKLRNMDVKVSKITVNSLAPRKCGSNFKSVIFGFIAQNSGSNHYMSHCRRTLLSWYSVTRPCWVNSTVYSTADYSNWKINFHITGQISGFPLQRASRNHWCGTCAS